VKPLYNLYNKSETVGNKKAQAKPQRVLLRGCPLRSLRDKYFFTQRTQRAQSKSTLSSRVSMSDSSPTILVATGNPGKVSEICCLFTGIRLDFRSLADFPDIVEVEETGSTFAKNAELKASGYAKQTGLWSLADDSGLEIEALGGRPGVLSARYGGYALSFPDKMRIVLDELENSSNPSRNARFVCAMALADETGRIRVAAEGECRGRIAPEPRGTGGFGYDPIFIPDGYDRTFGELPDAVKAQISHRARAAEKIMRYLLDFIGLST
jgi:XTP/dITP diphosphohydrolase